MFRRRVWHLIKYAIISLCITACAHIPKDEFRVSQAGVPYVLHLDYMDAPCPQIAQDAACVTWNSLGLAHVWMNSMAPPHVLSHEEAHVEGMLHSNWYWSYAMRETCSIVVRADIRNFYPVGTTICLSPTGERKIKKAD